MADRKFKEDDQRTLNLYKTVTYTCFYLSVWGNIFKKIFFDKMVLLLGVAYAQEKAKNFRHSFIKTSVTEKTPNKLNGHPQEIH